MKRCLLLLLVCGVQAYALDLEWVNVGDPGNQPDKTGYGTVAYEFQISKYEITSEQYAEFLNALAVKSDPHGLWRGSTIQRLGKPGEYRYQVIKGQERWPVVNQLPGGDAVRELAAQRTEPRRHGERCL